jgi:uncharacterized membrane protein
MADESVIGVYDDMAKAEEAVRTLEKSGFPIKQVSIVAQDLKSDNQVHGYVASGDVASSGAGAGAWVGGLFGVLVGAAFIWLPGFGPLLVAGPYATRLRGDIEGLVAGAKSGGLLGALAGWGVSEHHILKYEEHVKGGKYLLIAHGSAEEAARAHKILEATEAVQVTHHSEPGA